MSFFDIPAEALPADGKYYFNVTLFNIPVDDDDFKYEHYWNIEKICNPNPIAYHFFRCGTGLEDLVIEVEPDVVIETSSKGINWYRMYEEEELDEFDF